MCIRAGQLPSSVTFIIELSRVESGAAQELLTETNKGGVNFPAGVRDTQSEIQEILVFLVFLVNMFCDPQQSPL